MNISPGIVKLGYLHSDMISRLTWNISPGIEAAQPAVPQAAAAASEEAPAAAAAAGPVP